MKKWKCGVCGFIWDGDAAPDKCPKCNAAKDKYTQLDENATKLVERSRHSNMLHANVIALARQMEQVCKDGIKDNLDPGVPRRFQQVPRPRLRDHEALDDRGPGSHGQRQVGLR